MVEPAGFEKAEQEPGQSHLSQNGVAQAETHRNRRSWRPLEAKIPTLAQRNLRLGQGLAPICSRTAQWTGSNLDAIAPG